MNYFEYSERGGGGLSSAKKAIKIFGLFVVWGTRGDRVTHLTDISYAPAERAQKSYTKVPTDWGGSVKDGKRDVGVLIEKYSSNTEDRGKCHSTAQNMLKKQGA